MGNKNYYNKYLLNTGIRFNNVQIFLYWIYWFQGKGLLEYTDLVFPNEYKKNNKMILKYFHSDLKIVKMMKFLVILAINIENLKILKKQIFFLKNITSFYYLQYEWS